MHPIQSFIGRLALAAVLLLPAAPRAGAQEPPGVRATGEGVVLDFQEAELRTVVSALAELAGLSVVYSGLPSRTVTLRSPAPVSRAEVRRMLESVVRTNGLTLVEEGGLVRIAAEAPAPPPAPAPASPPPGAGASGPGEVRLFVYRLRHAEAEALSRTLRDAFGLGMERQGGPAAPGEAVPLSRELRRERIPLPGAAPEPGSPPPAGPPGERGPQPGMGAQLRAGVQIVPDALTNSLLVRATPADYETIREAVEELDVRPLQVLIEVLIAEVRRDRQRALGVEVSAPERKHAETGVSIGGSLAGGSAGDVALRVLGLGSIRADVVLRALSASSNVTILSRPIVLAQNNQEARILVGAQRPFVQISRALPTDGAVRDQVVQYRDVGTQLTIRPTINPDGHVTLRVLQEVSNATSETQFGAPIISTREAQTQLFVRDRHTAVIGGLIDQQRERGSSGVPILKDIPLLGRLFRSSRGRDDTTELFILLTPHVLRSDAEVEEVSREIREGRHHLREELREYEPLGGEIRPLKPKPN